MEGSNMKLLKLSLSVIFLCICVLAFSPELQAQRIPSRQCATITCLIDRINDANTNPGQDVILLSPGNYVLRAANNEANGPNGLPLITSSITIMGIPDPISGRKPSISRAAGNNFRIFYVKEGGALALSGLTISGGTTASSDDNAGRGGAIFVEENVHVTSQPNLFVSNVVFTSNRSTSHGGAIFVAGNGCCTTVKIESSTFFDNQSARGDGGAIYWNNFIPASGEPMTVQQSTFERNKAVNGTGGSIFVPQLTIGDDVTTVGLSTRSGLSLFRTTACPNCSVFTFDPADAVQCPDYFSNEHDLALCF